MSRVTCLTLLLLVGDIGRPAQSIQAADREKKNQQTLAEARKGFQTKLARRVKADEPVPEPPPKLFELVQYDSSVGKLAAYISPDPKDEKKHPAIVWITGGDCNSISDVWSDAPPDNDQTAKPFRESGFVMMFPSLRGGNKNPGFKEAMYGEVDDVLSALDFLCTKNYVDPKRIYLGGHSTGGTLVLLVAEVTDRFRAIFSFGPAENVADYGTELLLFQRNATESKLRSPASWLESIKSPTFVFEGTVQANLVSFLKMAGSTHNPKITFRAAKGATHFSILDPVNRLIAKKLLQDEGPECNLQFDPEEIHSLFRE